MKMYEIIPRVYGSAYRFSIPSGAAFNYLYRRFGIPSYGSDDKKVICDYYLQTKNDGLWVTFGIGGDKCYISYTMDRDVMFRFNLSEDDFVSACEKAVGDVLLDTLRPVYVRDVAIDILGRVTDQERFGEYNSETCRFEKEALPSKMAGYGIDADLLSDPDLYLEFIKVVRLAGYGNLNAGMRIVIDKLDRR